MPLSWTLMTLQLCSHFLAFPLAYNPFLEELIMAPSYALFSSSTCFPSTVLFTLVASITITVMFLSKEYLSGPDGSPELQPINPLPTEHTHTFHRHIKLNIPVSK